MRVLQAKFTGARTSGNNASRTRTVVTIDDDSDDGETTESEASTPEQEDMDNIGDMHGGSDGNDNYDHDGDVPFDDYTEKQGGLDTFFGSVGSSVRPVTDIAEGSGLVAAAVDPAQDTPEIGYIAQNVEIVPMVASSFDTFDRLVEAALAESFPTMPPTNSQDTTSTFRITNPLPPIFQHILRGDLEPAISPVLLAILRSSSFAFHGIPPVPSHIRPLLQTPEPSPLALLPAFPFGDTSAAENVQVVVAAGNTAAEHPSNASWLEWEESFAAFMAFFDGGVQVLRFANELLPLCHRFNGYATFRGALIYPETIAALEKFMDKYGDFTDMTSITSSFSQCATFRTLGLASG
ncbi:unnamed protein product [Prunus armeniaca]|uniref:Uncharacterized protein n=1 Tax=Prunus armeniaca TaxID=36596 RepID=A0A6J5WPU4_PRUAR|nr:unnamed protein product [Prunus armeniaca]